MSITEENIDRMYASLPPSSKARQADNPWAFSQYRNGYGTFGDHIFDHAVLCKDRDNGTYTWQIICNELTLSDIKIGD